MEGFATQIEIAIFNLNARSLRSLKTQRGQARREEKHAFWKNLLFAPFFILCVFALIKYSCGRAEVFNLSYVDNQIPFL